MRLAMAIAEVALGRRPIGGMQKYGKKQQTEIP
jgi:hypothetical protein